MHNNVAIMITVIRTVPATKQTSSHRLLNKRMDPSPTRANPEPVSRPRAGLLLQLVNRITWFAPDFAPQRQGAVRAALPCPGGPGVGLWEGQTLRPIRLSSPTAAPCTIEAG